MSSNAFAIELNDVWKKYSKGASFHRNLREDIVNIFRPKRMAQELHNNDFWALQQINFHVRHGESIGLYGPNGSGKSTILRLIANVTYPTRGTVSINGKIAPLLEIGAGFHPDLTGRENIFVNGAILGMTIKEIHEKIDAIIEFSGIRDFIDIPVKKFSSGMYIRLAFAIAIHSAADIYLFDEILTVGDKEFHEKCLSKIKELKIIGKTLLIVSHDQALLEQLTNHIHFIQKGQQNESILQNKEILT